MVGFLAPLAVMGGAALGFLGQRSANKTNQAIANRQMEFQEEMSSTAHQREVEDLRAAGLNPILSVHGGASSPGGASLPVANEMAALADGASSAVGASRIADQIANLRSETAKNEAQTALLGEQQGLARAQTVQTVANTALTVAREGTERVRPDLVVAQTGAQRGVPAVQQSTIRLQGAQAGVARQEEHRIFADNTFTHKFGPPGNIITDPARTALTQGTQIGGTLAPGVISALRALGVALPQPTNPGNGAPPPPPP